MKRFTKLNNLAVYKFGLIAPVLHDSHMSRNQYFKQLANKGVEIPPKSGDKYFLAVSTFKSWYRKYITYGLEGLAEKIRSDKGTLKKVTDYIRNAVDEILNDEKNPVVSVRDLYRKLIRKGYITDRDVSYETLRTYIRKYRLLELRDAKKRKKFEKEFVNDLWMVDFMQGKSIRARVGKGKRMLRTYLCAIIDDSSRLLVGYEWGLHEDTALFARAFKRAISTFGTPKILYCDQGKVFLSNYIVQLCGRLGIALVHAQPYQPASKGKIERFNRTVQQMFYPLIDDFSALSIEQLKERFATFVSDIYHIKKHSSLGVSPLEKYRDNMSTASIRRISEEQLRLFFLYTRKRKVRNDSTVIIHNTYYEVDLKYRGEWIYIGFCLDHPDRFYQVENNQVIKELRPVNLVENANPPHISANGHVGMADSFSRLLGSGSSETNSGKGNHHSSCDHVLHNTDKGTDTLLSPVSL